MALGLTKRQKILQRVFDIVESAETDLGTKWQTKVKTPLLGVASQVRCPAFSVFDHQEQVTQTSKPGIGMVRCKLTLLIEFWTSTTLSDDVSTELNRVLGSIQKAIGADPHLQNQAYSIEEFGSKYKVETDKQRLVMGEVAYVVTYHRDPKAPVGA